MVAIRQRISDALLRVGTERSLERQELERGIAGTRSDARGRACAAEALMLASCLDSAVLWLGWRLRPATAYPGR